MRLLVASDEHYISDGKRIYNDWGTMPYKFWTEYLEVFDQVLVFARVRREDGFVGQPEKLAEGPNVEFFEIPYFRGPSQYLRARSNLARLAREAVLHSDAFLLRVPGLVGTMVAKALWRVRRPYAVQVVSDPWDVFGAGRVGGTLRPVYRHVLTQDLKRICKSAEVLQYVTQRSLQARYTPSNTAFVSAWSDVQIGSAILSEDELRARVNSLRAATKRSKILGWVGTLQEPYKRPDILLKAAAICSGRGLDFKVRFAGGGRLQPEYERLAAQLGIAEKVEFLGLLPAGRPVFEFIDSLDIFVMSSPAEGLPRAMIEAMARGCPCIGSNSGGIPELLDEGELVKPLDPGALADKIMEKLAQPDELARMAVRNHQEAKKYLPDRVAAARSAFLAAIRERTQRPQVSYTS
jgi:glycosyltransferase involved in cell wall biosynthesis